MENKIFKQLEKIKDGYLIIYTPSNEKIEVGDIQSKLHADITINNWNLFDLVLSKGDIGFGEAYMKNIFTTTDIVNLLLLISLNQKVLDSLFHSNILYSIFFGIKNLFKKNSLHGSKKNIEYHYDLGNDFYSLWLDKSMSYSSGIFDKNNDLNASQINKYQRILKQISAGSEILEIGCGWGAFINEASNSGHSIKGLTLSTQQKSYSEKLIKNKELNAYVVLQDYRLETKEFDNIVSIEMFEAVGKKYWDDYFTQIKKCLKKDGKAIIQTITIDDEFYQKYLKTSDYIREYIFPGGFLPSPSVFRNLAKKHGLLVINEFAFGNSYAKTVLQWLNNFNNAEDKIIQLGYSQQFIKMWQFYLAYCAAGFNTKRTNVIQFTLTHD